MGWEDYHLHEFKIDGKCYGMPEDAWDDPRIHDEKKVRLGDLELKEKQKFDYIYDFGDHWGHEVKLEKILLPESSTKYPKCLDGAMACPPEDCFGPPGYDSLIKLTERTKDKLDEHDLERLKWLGKDHDFEYFSVDEVNSALWKRFAK